MLGLHVCSMSALLQSPARQPLARQQQLLMLRDIAQVKQNLAKAEEVVVAGGVADTASLFASLQLGTKELVSNLRRFDEPMIEAQPESSWPRWTSTLNPGRLQTSCRWGRTLQTLQSQASDLHVQVDEQREQLELFRGEEMGTERVQQVFDAIDVKGDGMVCLEEFTKASSTLLATSFGLSGEALGIELKNRFERADVDKNGTLDFQEFQGFVRDLRGDAVGPLRAARARGLEALLEICLEQCSLSLARELTAAATDGPRMTELSACVDRWCVLDARCRVLDARTVKGDDEGACADALEATLQQVSALASDLALTNLTETVGFSAKRSARQLWGGARASIAFCYRGLRITLGDVIESFGLLGRLLAGNSLTLQDSGLIRRTVADVSKLVPYTIIMVIPMSPPGHVFAFSVLNRVFPNAVPSAFTAQRQDINDIYTRIAAEASSEPRRPARSALLLATTVKDSVLAFTRKPAPTLRKLWAAPAAPA
jgi:Ca2+-binding EF-hand superfamily protein